MTHGARHTLLAAVLLGIGFMAAIDEIIFHQLLVWHHFVESDSTTTAIISDGILHTLELVLLITGGTLMLKLHETGHQVPGYRSAGFLLGMGGFQVFDGIIDHKVLGLHQIRYVDNLLLYDLVWNGVGLLLIIAGYVLLKRSMHSHNQSQHP